MRISYRLAHDIDWERLGYFVSGFRYVTTLPLLCVLSPSHHYFLDLSFLVDMLVRDIVNQLGGCGFIGVHRFKKKTW